MEAHKDDIVRYRFNEKEQRGKVVHIFEPEFKDGSFLYVVQSFDSQIKDIIKESDIISVETA